MSRLIICDRCGAKITGRIGYVRLNWRPEPDREMAPNPYEDMDLCEDCTVLIASVIDSLEMIPGDELRAEPDVMHAVFSGTVFEAAGEAPQDATEEVSDAAAGAPAPESGEPETVLEKPKRGRKKKAAADPEEEPKKKTKKKTKAAPEKKIDTGKIRALWTAGWSIPKIAIETGLEDEELKAIMKKRGLFG